MENIKRGDDGLGVSQYLNREVGGKMCNGCVTGDNFSDKDLKMEPGMEKPHAH